MVIHNRRRHRAEERRRAERFAKATIAFVASAPTIFLGLMYVIGGYELFMEVTSCILTLAIAGSTMAVLGYSALHKSEDRPPTRRRPVAARQIEVKQYHVIKG